MLFRSGALTTTVGAALPGALPGRSYTYAVEAILRSFATGGGTNGTTTGTTTATQVCYIRSDRTSSSGRATPLFPPSLGSTPPSNVPLQGNQDFVFVPGQNGNTARFEYILQISQSNAFTQNVTTNVATLSDGTTRFRSVNVTNLFPNFTGTLWWRVGVRNLDDSPGPVPDQSGAPYIFGRIANTNYRSFTRPAGPPPPP